MALLVATNEMLAAPMGTSNATAQARDGAAATARMVAPKASPMQASSRVDGWLWNAVVRPPRTAPAPMATMNRLYSAPPPPKVNFASSGSVTVKLNANTPMTAMEMSGSFRSGVAHT